MKIAISNIAWSAEQDKIIYEKMMQMGFTGLEIAPTRIFLKKPYEHLDEARKWKKDLHHQYGFEVPSMQSIWYGRTESIFGTPEERKILQSYTYQAIDFASAIGCQNLVFGCPKNRYVPENVNPDLAISFFQEIAAYAVLKGTVIGLEANPKLYHTNYINTTSQALALIERVSSPGFRLNLDVGTILYNQENVLDFAKKIEYINHVHISEPKLSPIRSHETHKVLKTMLERGYKGFVSLEMTKPKKIEELLESCIYLKEVFG